jgi:hypothetical protein
MRSRPATLLRNPSIRFPSGEETAIVQSLVPGNPAHADLLVLVQDASTPRNASKNVRIVLSGYLTPKFSCERF